MPDFSAAVLDGLIEDQDLAANISAILNIQQYSG
jgi:hypothetical protein